MAMTVSPVPFFWANVEFDIPGDFGTRLKVSFQAKYRRVEQEEYEALMRRLQAARVVAFREQLDADSAALVTLGDAPADSQSAPRLTDREVIDKYLLGWGSDMLGDDNQPLPFNPENLARVERILGCRAAMSRTFFEAHHQAPEKNSETPSDTSTGG